LACIPISKKKEDPVAEEARPDARARSIAAGRWACCCRYCLPYEKATLARRGLEVRLPRFSHRGHEGSSSRRSGHLARPPRRAFSRKAVKTSARGRGRTGNRNRREEQHRTADPRSTVEIALRGPWRKTRRTGARDSGGARGIGDPLNSAFEQPGAPAVGPGPRRWASSRVEILAYEHNLRRLRRRGTRARQRHSCSSSDRGPVDFFFFSGRTTWPDTRRSPGVQAGDEKQETAMARRR